MGASRSSALKTLGVFWGSGIPQMIELGSLLIESCYAIWEVSQEIVERLVPDRSYTEYHHAIGQTNSPVRCLGKSRRLSWRDTYLARCVRRSRSVEDNRSTMSNGSSSTVPAPSTTLLSAKSRLPHADLASPAGCLGELPNWRDALGALDLLRTTDRQCRTARPRPFQHRVPPYYRLSYLSRRQSWKVPQAVLERYLPCVMR
ncbi:hypothetical protein VN12_07095 [Pirellula sp. SH-Sr6A]|nr:hypothetical protein VN12_07095 [Pirellula sp. SH-Sr6A]